MAFSDAFECYQSIGALLSRAITEPWIEAVVDVKLNAEEQWVEIQKWYVPAADGEAKKAFPYIPGLDTCFYDLAPLLSNESKGFYKRCVFKLWPNGKYDAALTY